MIVKLIKDIYPVITYILVIFITLRCLYIHKYKTKIDIFKEIVNILFIIYIVILYYLVSMPIYRFKVINLIPFKEIFRYKILSKLFIKNTIGNMLLFIPYSLYLTYIFKIKKLYIILISSSILIITIEILQINIGRVFDIDDIILNIISSILGYLLSKICIK